MKFIPLDILLLQQEYLAHLNQCTYSDGSILGAYFTMNLNVQPSTPTTPIPSPDLYDSCAHIMMPLTTRDTDCNSSPNVQPHHDVITNTRTHSDSENQPTQRTIHIGNHVLSLPPIRTSMQPPTTLRQPPERSKDLMAQSNLSLSDFSQVHKSRDHELTPIVARFQTLIASGLPCDSSDPKTTTTTPTIPTTFQLRNCAGDPADCTNPGPQSYSIDCAAPIPSTTSTIVLMAQ